jgi:hypothetical protein
VPGSVAYQEKASNCQDELYRAEALRAESALSREPGRASIVWRTVGLGALLAVAQLMLGCLLSGASSPRKAYESLFQWDGGWFLTVVEWGYFNPSYPNTAFFPGYPLTARLVKEALGLSGKLALLLTAQLACAALWTYLLLFFRRWRVPPRLAGAAILAIWAHPAAFFLVASYSESLFLAALLGFFYWSEERGWLAAVLAALHGFGMTATRLVGAPLSAYPVVHAWFTQGRRARFLTNLVVGATATLGIILYFAFCWVRFGKWNLYMEAEQAGWGMHPDYLGLFSRRIFMVHWPCLREGFIDPVFLSRLSAPLWLLLFATLFWLEWTKGCERRQRAGFILSALLLYYVSVSGGLSLGLWSMIRFSFCIWVVFLLAMVHHVTHARTPRWQSRKAVVLWALVCLASFACEVALIHRFTHGKWVA